MRVPTTNTNPVNGQRYPVDAALSTGVVLTCASPTCRHTYEPDREARERADTDCPRCGGWTMAAELVEPSGDAA